MKLIPVQLCYLPIYNIILKMFHKIKSLAVIGNSKIYACVVWIDDIVPVSPVGTCIIVHHAILGIIDFFKGIKGICKAVCSKTVGHNIANIFINFASAFK